MRPKLGIKFNVYVLPSSILRIDIEFQARASCILFASPVELRYHTLVILVPFKTTEPDGYQPKYFAIAIDNDE